MKLARRTFLHLAAGAVALPALLRIARAQTLLRRREGISSGPLHSQLAGGIEWGVSRLEPLPTPFSWFRA